MVKGTITTHTLRKLGNIHARNHTTKPETRDTASAPDQMDSDSIKSLRYCLSGGAMTAR